VRCLAFTRTVPTTLKNMVHGPVLLHRHQPKHSFLSAVHWWPPGHGGKMIQQSLQQVHRFDLPSRCSGQRSEAVTSLAYISFFRVLPGSDSESARRPVLASARTSTRPVIFAGAFLRAHHTHTASIARAHTSIPGTQTSRAPNTHPAPARNRRPAHSHAHLPRAPCPSAPARSLPACACQRAFTAPHGPTPPPCLLSLALSL
jgi:hypothetical protein